MPDDTNGTWDVFVRRVEAVDPLPPPASTAGPLDATYATSPIGVPFVIESEGAGVTEVELWWRYRTDEASEWGDWSLGPTGTTSPISFDFSSGPGFYEFYTIAIDAASTREEPPPAAETTTRFAPPPATPAGPLSATYATQAIGVPFVIDDPGSGVVDIELWWRYRTDEASAWGDWSL